jgi:hypothetical protein
MGINNAEQRRYQRGTSATQPTGEHVVSTIIETFREMPGLCLHLNQAARLFGLPASTCEVILRDLVAQGTLRRAHDGQYRGAQLDDIRRIRPPSDLMAAARSALRLTTAARTKADSIFRDRGPAS